MGLRGWKEESLPHFLSSYRPPHTYYFFIIAVFFFGITSVRFCGGESSLGIGDWLRNEKLGLVVAAVFA